MTSTVIDFLEVGLGVPGAARAFWQERGSPETQPNGALMRCAPVALKHALEPQSLIEQTAATCAVTHFAPRRAVVVHAGQCRDCDVAQGQRAEGATI